MNFNLDSIPGRNKKPRIEGMTIIMDKGLSVEEARNCMSIGHQYTDLVKLGFGTAYVTPNLAEKLEVYSSFILPVYLGGSLFEAFLIRNQLDDYIRVCEKSDIKYMEISDG